MPPAKKMTNGRTPIRKKLMPPKGINVKIIHGIGEGKLLKAVRDYLKTDKNVLEFRPGKFGEGENGVTIVKLK